MTHDPRTKKEIYESLRSSLTGKISKLTNFTDRSFNYVWTQAFSEEVRELEVLAYVSELAAFIDYSGGPITEDDLEDLGVNDVLDADEVNRFMQDSYLDEFVKIVGITRDQGAKATGSVTITTQSEQTEIPKGTRVTTEVSEDGDTLDFLTTEQAETASGVTTVTDVSIQAVEVGDEYNLPANKIVRFAEPPVGVKGVTNPSSTTGGREEESNEELRARAKDAVSTAGEGGTAAGVRGYIREEIDAVGTGDVILDEHSDKSPPYVDVVVDGGVESEVLDAIDFSRPAGIKHNLIRPTVTQVRVNTDVSGTDVSVSSVRTELQKYLLELGIGNNLYSDDLTRSIMQSDEDIFNIDNLDVAIERVTNERFTYDSSQADYRLKYTYDSNGEIRVEDENGEIYTQGTDYTIEDRTGDGFAETIVWDTNNNNPSNGENFSVDYDVIDQTTPREDWYYTDEIRDEEHVFEKGRSETYNYEGTDQTYRLDKVPFPSTTSISDASGDTYSLDVDFSLISVGTQSTSDVFTYKSGQTNYRLEVGADETTVSITDDSGNTYTRGTDYDVIDASGDGVEDTISWNTSNNTPDDNEGFTVDYKTDNGLEQTVDWSGINLGGAVAEDASSGTTDETVEANDDTADDMTLLPSSPATGDAYYFGHEQQFDDIRVDISTAGAGTWDIVWEYYDGSGWVSLSGVTDGTSDFQNSGINEVSWTVPSNWSTTSVGGIGGLYWVRARLASFSSMSTQPLGRRADQDDQPDDNEDFTVTYDASVYETDYDIRRSDLDESIQDSSGNTYSKGAEYTLTDYNTDNELDAVRWLDPTVTPDDGEAWYVSYGTEGDLVLSDREKVDPGTIFVEVV